VQFALRNFEIASAQLANSEPKPYAHPKPDLNPNPNPSRSQIALRSLQIAHLHKIRATL